jgi:hypothetical protein
MSLNSDLALVESLARKVSKELSTEAKSRIEIEMADFIAETASVLRRYLDEGRPEEWLRGVFERNRKRFYRDRAAKRIELSDNPDVRSLIAKYCELKNVAGASAQEWISAENLVNHVGVESALEGIEWFFETDDEYISSKRPLSLIYIEAAWPAFERNRALAPDPIHKTRLTREIEISLGG